MRVRTQAGIFTVAFLGLVSLTFLLSACSLAEDITPPPGYQNNTPIPALEQGSPTPDASGTPTPLVSSTGAAGETPAQPGGSATPSALITLQGKVSNGTSGSLPSSPLTANLYLYDTSTTGIDQKLTAQVDPTGQFRFENVPANSKVTYYIMVDYSGITYVSDAVTYDGAFKSKDVPITIYDPTEDLNQLSFSQVHLQFDFPTSGQAQARVLYVVSNLGDKSVLVKTDGTQIPFIQIPAGATKVQYELAQGGSPLARATDGFALLPGSDKQYGLIATFDLPYSSNASITQPFSLPASAETVLVPAGMRVKSSQLSDAGVQSVQGTNYHLYQGGDLASGGSLSFSISGKPGATSLSYNQQMTILLTLLGAGLVLIGAGIFLLRRKQDRAAPSPEVEAASEPYAPTTENKDAVMDAIIALDDQYKVGSIDRAAYSKRRDVLKKRLKELL